MQTNLSKFLEKNGLKMRDLKKNVLLARWSLFKNKSFRSEEI